MTTTVIKEALGALENVELDLKGFAFPQAVEFVTQAFENERTDLSTMIKVTLVVGAGKEKRMKYDEELPKWIISTLKSLGYEEDHAAATDSFVSSGKYKYQHDTNKNLKYVHVFPKAVQKRDTDSKENENIAISENSGNSANTNAVIDVPEAVKELIGKGLKKEEIEARWFCLVSKLGLFKEIVSNKIISWTQKKRCKDLIDQFKEMQIGIENKLAAMKELTDSETKVYYEVIDLNEKEAFLVEEIKHMVDAGNITDSEKKVLLEELRKKLANSSNPIVSQKLQERLKIAENQESKSILKIIPFIDEGAIKKKLRESLPLEALEEKAGPKGLWSPKLTPAEVHSLKQKLELDAEIDAAISKCKCYFETDDELKERKLVLIKEVKATIVKKAVGIKAMGSNGGWNTVSVTKKSAPDFSKQPKKQAYGKFTALVD